MFHALAGGPSAHNFKGVLMKQLFYLKRIHGSWEILNNALVVAGTETEARKLVVAEHTKPATRDFGTYIQFDTEEFMDPNLVTCEIVDLSQSKYLLGEVAS